MIRPVANRISFNQPLARLTFPSPRQPLRQYGSAGTSLPKTTFPFLSDLLNRCGITLRGQPVEAKQLIILASEIVRQNHTPKNVNPILEDLVSGLKSNKLQIKGPLDLLALLKTVDISKSERLFIALHTGLDVANLSEHPMRPYSRLFPADRLEVLQKAIDGERDEAKLWFVPEHDLISKLKHEEALRNKTNSDTAIWVPKFVPWGIWTLRALDNFPPYPGLSKHAAPLFVRGVLRAKEAALIASREEIEDGELGQRRFAALILAIRQLLEVPDGAQGEYFPLETIQGGAGTSFNMTVNEVIANTAMAILGGRKSGYHDPETGVSLELPNINQSTNDVIPAGLLMGIQLSFPELFSAIKDLTDALTKRAKEFEKKKLIVLVQTEGQPAVLLYLSDIFRDYVNALKKATVPLTIAYKATFKTPLGGTAVGAGHNASPTYRANILKALCSVTKKKGWQFPEDQLAETRDPSSFDLIADTLNFLSRRLQKIADDLWDKTRVKEFIHPHVQAGSSIMPGKVNPVYIEHIQQLCRKASGQVETVRSSLLSYASRINSHLPLIGHEVFSTLADLTKALRVARRLIEGLEVNEVQIKRNITENPGPIITAVAGHFPHWGHELGDRVSARLRASEATPTIEFIEGIFQQVAIEMNKDSDEVVRIVRKVYKDLSHLARPHG